MKQARGRLARAVLAAAVAVVASTAAAEDWEKVDAPMPDFVVLDQDGGRLKRDDLLGKVVMIDFWATWCAPCLQELPGLAAWHERLEEDDPVVLLSFNVLDDPEQVKKFIAENEVHFPIYTADDLLETLEIVGFPTKLIVDMRGEGEPRIVYTRVGFSPAEEVEPRVAEVLAAAP